MQAVTALHVAPKLARSRASLGPVSTHRIEVSWPSGRFLCLPCGQGVLDTQSHKSWRER